MTSNPSVDVGAIAGGLAAILGLHLFGLEIGIVVAFVVGVGTFAFTEWWLFYREAD